MKEYIIIISYEGVYLGTHPVYIPTNVGYMVDNLYLQMISCSAGIPREATGRLFIYIYIN